MLQAEKIVHIYSHLPAAAQQEALDFMLFLQQRYGDATLLKERDSESKLTQSTVKNPLAELLASELIGCAEADPKLSRNYKAELRKSWGEKHGYR